jgi:hypothetical protein
MASKAWISVISAHLRRPIRPGERRKPRFCMGTLSDFDTGRDSRISEQEVPRRVMEEEDDLHSIDPFSLTSKSLP